MTDVADDRLPERVQTTRLLLRRWKHDEASVLTDLIQGNIEHLGPWMPWTKFEPQTVAERVALIETWTREWEDGGGAVFGTFFDGGAIGSCEAAIVGGQSRPPAPWPSCPGTRAGRCPPRTAGDRGSPLRLGHLL